MKETTHLSVWRLVFSSLLIAVTVLGIACANSSIVPPAKAEPTPLRATAVATPVKIEPTPVRATVVATPETGRWKQFSSKKYGVEFQYPESCKISEQDESLNVGGRIELSILESEGMGLSEYVTKFVKNKTEQADWTIESTKNETLGGQESRTVEYRFGGQKRFGTATFAVRGDKVYVWGLTAGGFTCDEPNVYGPILASFRFTKQPATEIPVASSPTSMPSLPMAPTFE